MMKIVLLILLIVSANLSFSQDLDGTWRVGYIRTIERIYSVDDSSDTTDTYQAFRLGNGIFEFDDKRVTIHNFIDKPKRQKIKNSNLLRFKGMELTIDSFNKDSVVLRTEKDIENYIVLIPFKSKKIQINEDDFKNSEWQVESKSSCLSSVKFHFSDTSTLICNYQGAKYGYANYGEWRIHHSGKYHLLYISDREHMEEYVFYCSYKSGESIHATISEQSFLEHPTNSDVKLIKKRLLAKNELQEKEGELVGNWTFVEFTNQADTVILDSLINLELSIRFKEDGKYEYSNIINSVIRGENVNYTTEEHGIWQVASNGTYIITKPEDSWEEYLSIYFIDENSLILDFNYEYDKRSTFATRIKMERND